MRSRTRAGAALGAALALAAAAACTDDPAGGGESAAVQEYDETRLVDMVNESARLLYELESAEFRIIQHCLEAQDFTVHDQFWFSAYEPEEQETLFGADDWGNWLPTAEEAAEFGVGSWSITAEGQASPELEAYYEHRGIDPSMEAGMASGDGGGLPDNSAFEALAPEDQYDWYVAYFGEATAASEYEHLTDEDTSVDDTSGADGEIDLSDGFDYVQPEPGGCQREMIDALYGEPRLVQDPEGQEYREATWSYRPENPMDDHAAYEEFDLRYLERIAAVQGELVDCLAEHGHPGWEFGEEGTLPIADYFYELYEGVADVHDHPDLPADAPTDYEARKSFEIAFAVELAACGDETGYRATAAQAWGDTQEEYYLSIETSVYGWQEEIRAILTTAQDVIEG
jgi:hypothetical protein